MAASRRCFAQVVAAALLAVSVVPALAGCSSGRADVAPGAPQVVASTDVWGAVAAAVGGADAQVTSVVDSPDQDPHSFQASARTLLALRHADLVVANGGGYDPFVAQLLRGVPHPPPVVEAVALSPAAGGGADANEHVFLDLPTVRRVASLVAERLGALASDHAQAFRARAAVLDRRLAGLEGREARLRAAYGGAGVLETEPVAHYLLAAAGLRDRAPDALAASLEAGEGVPASVLRTALERVRARDVALVVPNASTTGPETTRLLAAARTAGVPVVPVGERLPAGEDYPTWVGGILTAVARALSR